MTMCEPLEDGLLGQSLTVAQQRLESAGERFEVRRLAAPHSGSGVWRIISAQRGENGLLLTASCFSLPEDETGRDDDGDK